jgi:exodeoxyribonuclease-3
VSSLDYDELDRLTFAGFGTTGPPESPSYDSTITYTYDNGDRLTEAEDSEAGTITRAYDELDRLTSETTPERSVAYGYDDADRRQTMTVVGQPQVSYKARQKDATVKRFEQSAGELGWTIRRSGRRVGRGAAVGGADTVGSVRIATWNVNSVKQRVPRLLPWLDERRPDVVCLQETKLADDAFLDLLGDELRDRGYAVAVHGEATWNGVAILSRVGLDDVVVGLAGAPGFPRPESRAVSATCGGIRVVSVYVPNGRVPDSEHYQYKLAWLASLREMVAAGPEATVVCGDMNIAPTDDDVFDPEAYVGQTHVTPLERAALAELQALGLRDVVRDRWPNERVFTYWDYRAGMFHQDLGMRIDLVLASETVAGRVRAAWVDRQARKGSGPSDHAPVIVDMDEAPNGDIGPVVPPPSAPVTTRGSPKLPQSP